MLLIDGHGREYLAGILRGKNDQLHMLHPFSITNTYSVRYPILTIARLGRCDMDCHETSFCKVLKQPRRIKTSEKADPQRKKSSGLMLTSGQSSLKILIVFLRLCSWAFELLVRSESETIDYVSV